MMQEPLIEEIEEYWTNRAEGYSEVNQKELAGEQKEKWLRVLQQKIKNHFPTKKPQEIKVLDIGTGPGFFAIILATAGYQVTAVDYTEAMLEEARDNAGALAEQIHFQRMDGQQLDFAPESFDVIISRNLTWVLTRPDKAYHSWREVLKTGGLMLNFDANWYSYLYDEEKQREYEQDRKAVEEEGLFDYNVGENFDVMESIAREVPLSSMQRPLWDIEVLKDLNMDARADTGIWAQVWSQEEKINFSSTPMFLVEARK